jgi:hypothetical protein
MSDRRSEADGARSTRGDEATPAGADSSTGEPAGGDGDDSWVRQAESAVRRRAAWVRETARLDLAALDSLPGGHQSVFVGVGVMVGLFSLLRVGIADLYTESLPFLVLAIVVGTLGWTPGVVLVVGHAVVDLVVSLGDLSLGTLVGRGVSYVVLYALVVSIPATQRAVHARLDRLDRQYSWLDPVAAPASAVWAGALVALWAEVAPYLVRAAFERSPNVAAVATIQDNAVLLAAVTVLVAGATAIGYQRRVGVMVTRPWPADERLLPGRFVWLRRLLRYGVVVALVSGILTSALDLVILAVALFAADLTVPRVVGNPTLKRALLAIPYTVRLGLAFVLTFLVASTVMTIRYAPVGDSEFFPLVTSLAVGLFVFRVLLNVDEPDEPTGGDDDRTRGRDGRDQTADVSDTADEEPGSARSVSSVLLVLAALLVLASVPEPVLAHDCSGLADCENGARAGTAAGVTALALALWYWTSGPTGTDGSTAGGSHRAPDATADAALDRTALDGTAVVGSEVDSIGEAADESQVPADDADDEREEDDTDAAGELEIAAVVAGETPATEYVVLRNVGDAHLDLSGWTVADDAGHAYRIPRGVVLEPGTRLRLYTGEGADTESVRYWGEDETRWAGPDARVTVRNAVGDVVAAEDVAAD